MYKYKLTGLDINKKRLKIESNNFAYLNCLNVFSGNLWELMENGKYKKIKTILN